jgi:ribosome-binding factor A
MAERRPERVAHLVQAALAAWFLRDATDRRLQRVTVTGVRMSPDLRVAHVYFRTLDGPAAEAETVRALGRATPHLRRVLGAALALRVTPELRFDYDEAPDRARRVEELLRAGATRRDDDEQGR